MGEKSIQKKQYILKKAREVFVKRGYGGHRLINRKEREYHV